MLPVHRRSASAVPISNADPLATGDAHQTLPCSSPYARVADAPARLDCEVAGITIDSLVGGGLRDVGPCSSGNPRRRHPYSAVCSQWIAGACCRFAVHAALRRDFGSPQGTLALALPTGTPAGDAEALLCAASASMPSCAGRIRYRAVTTVWISRECHAGARRTRHIGPTWPVAYHC